MSFSRSRSTIYVPRSRLTSIRTTMAPEEPIHIPHFLCVRIQLLDFGRLCAQDSRLLKDMISTGFVGIPFVRRGWCPGDLTLPCSTNLLAAALNFNPANTASAVLHSLASSLLALQHLPHLVLHALWPPSHVQPAILVDPVTRQAYYRYTKRRRLHTRLDEEEVQVGM